VNTQHKTAESIVIIGGGAGGLELAIKLGRYFKKSSQKVVLVDQSRTHIWKPLLHEVAAGSLDADIDGVDYLSLSHKNGFIFHLGTMCALDRDNTLIQLSPLLDMDGEVILPERSVHYDQLIFAVGSVTNDFGTEGAKDHCIFLDSPNSAQRFHNKLLNEFLRLQSDNSQASLEIAIVGAGATGVELAAELFKTAELLNSFGYDHVSTSRLNVKLIEAGPRLLPALPDRIAQNVRAELEKLGVEIKLNTQVSKIEKHGLTAKSGEFISSAMAVWAAGIKAPDFMHEIAGLETNRINQLVVNRYLQCNNAPKIYALGDCAHCIMPDESKVPPRAQSAHQMASLLFKNIKLAKQNKPQQEYQYVDYGSLVSLSTYSTIGSLMGNLTKGSLFIEGRLARMVYISLYRMHQLVVYGKIKTVLFMFANRINRRLRPNLKLH